MNSILVIIPYQNLYPSINGGMQRCFHVLHQLAKYYHVTAIIAQPKKQFLECVKEFPVMANVDIRSIPDKKRDLASFLPLSNRLKNALRQRWYSKTIFTTTNLFFVWFYPMVKRVSKEKKFSLAVVENGGMDFVVNLLKRYQPNIKVVYDAHNVDSILAYRDFAAGKISKHTFECLQNREQSLYNIYNGFFACSNKDTAALLEMNNNKIIGVTIPNAAVVNETICDDAVNTNEPEFIIFCGSLDYPPNFEGLIWFYNQVWPIVKKNAPALKLLVVGSGEMPGCLKPLLQDDSLIFTGRVKDVKPYYKKATVAIVPILAGSGTRLKILEAMGFGIPIVSTSKGAEGVAYQDEENILIADDTILFSSRLIQLLQNRAARIRLQHNGLKLVKEKYDWDVIGTDLKKFIDNLINE